MMGVSSEFKTGFMISEAENCQARREAVEWAIERTHNLKGAKWVIQGLGQSIPYGQVKQHCLLGG